MPVKKTATTSKSADKAKKQTGRAIADDAESIERLKRMLHFDVKLRRKKETVLIGTDEVGRGCLAGPVVAAAVILPPIKNGSRLAKALAELNDSKQLSSEKRESLAEVIHAHAACAIAESSVEEIENINILRASLLAMLRAITELRTSYRPDVTEYMVAVDGNRKIHDLDLHQVTVIEGDAHSASIAAASVIAKVYRDRLMKELAPQFPHYLWESNKGYASKKHRDAIHEHGITVWHRRTFLKSILNQQLTLDLGGQKSIVEELEETLELDLDLDLDLDLQLETSDS